MSVYVSNYGVEVDFFSTPEDQAIFEEMILDTEVENIGKVLSRLIEFGIEFELTVLTKKDDVEDGINDSGFQKISDENFNYQSASFERTTRELELKRREIIKEIKQLDVAIQETEHEIDRLDNFRSVLINSDHSQNTYKTKEH